MVDHYVNSQVHEDWAKRCRTLDLRVLGRWVGVSGFDVSRAFAVGVGGAAPELGGGLAGGAAAHGFVTDRAPGDSCLFSSGLDSGGVEALGEAAVFFEIATLALDLAFEEIGCLIDGTKHGIGREFGFGFGDELSESGKAGEHYFSFGRSRKIGEDIVLEPFPHGEALA